MQIVVVGAGVAGLGTSLMLSKAGHSVTLLERDPAPPEDPEEAWSSWERKGVPQARLAHVFLGGSDEQSHVSAQKETHQRENKA